MAGGTVVFVANATSKLGGLLEMSTLHSTYLTVPVLKTDIHEWVRRGNRFERLLFVRAVGWIAHLQMTANDQSSRRD